MRVVPVAVMVVVSVHDWGGPRRRGSWRKSIRGCDGAECKRVQTIQRIAADLITSRKEKTKKQANGPQKTDRV